MMSTIERNNPGDWYLETRQFLQADGSSRCETGVWRPLDDDEDDADTSDISTAAGVGRALFWAARSTILTLPAMLIFPFSRKRASGGIAAHP